MRWRLRLSVLLGVAAMCSGLGGFQTAAAQSASRSRAEHRESVGIEWITPGLVVQSRAARFQFILGRLSLHPPSHITCERFSALPESEGTERVRVTAARGIPSLLYELRTPHRAATVNVSDATEVRIESEVHMPSGVERMELVQPSRGPITVRWQLQQPDAKAVAESEMRLPSLVHLRAHSPERYAHHLSPLLGLVLESAPAECAVDDLLRILDHSDPSTGIHAQVREHVDRLRSPIHRQRSEAERSLIDLGLPALALINSLDPTDFDTEQRLRLRRVERALAPTTSDTTDRLARWLVTDIRYWNMVAPAIPPVDRAEVSASLARLTGRAIDPTMRVAETTAGPEASPRSNQTTRR